MENNAKKAKQKLDKELGRTEKDLLLDLIGEIRLLKKDLPQLDKLQQELETGNEISVKHFKRLIEVAKQLKVELPDKFKVEVINQQEYPEKIKISNLDEIVIPKRVSIKEAGWLVKLLVKLTDEVQDLIKRTFNVSLDNHTLPPDRALPVRLVTRGGRYYTARSGSSTVSGGSAPDHSTSDKQDDIITALDTPTGINGGPVTVGTTAVEITFTGTTKVISLMSDADNDGKIWWGESNVANDGSNALGRLTPDRAVEIELDDSSESIYMISDTVSQTIYKVALTA